MRRVFSEAICHLTPEETAQRGSETSPKPHNQQIAQAGTQPRHPAPASTSEVSNNLGGTFHPLVFVCDLEKERREKSWETVLNGDQVKT